MMRALILGGLLLLLSTACAIPNGAAPTGYMHEGTDELFVCRSECMEPDSLPALARGTLVVFGVDEGGCYSVHRQRSEGSPWPVFEGRGFIKQGVDPEGRLIVVRTGADYGWQANLTRSGDRMVGAAGWYANNHRGEEYIVARRIGPARREICPPSRS